MAHPFINALVSVFTAAASPAGEAAHRLPVMQAFTTQNVLLYSPGTVPIGHENEKPRIAEWLERSQAQLDALASCGKGDCEALKTMNPVWAGRIEALRGKTPEERLAYVNTRVNTDIYYTFDSENFGVEDYWQSPVNALVSRKGDCEDYALTKMELLKALGIREQDMRVLLVKDSTRNNIDHAVLAVRHKGETYILDNLEGDIKPARDFPQYSITAGIDDRGLWTYPGMDISDLVDVHPDGPRL